MRRERATVRSTIYNQIGCGCVRVWGRYAPRAHSAGCRAKQWCARSIIPHYTICFRGRRTYTSRQPTSFVAVRSSSLFTSRTMHSEIVSVVSSTVRLSLNYDWAGHCSRCFCVGSFCEHYTRSAEILTVRYVPLGESDFSTEQFTIDFWWSCIFAAANVFCLQIISTTIIERFELKRV